MTAMLTRSNPPVDEDREARPDWVVVARIMWGQDPRCVPAESEIRAAVWLLLDQGYGQMEIVRHTRLPEKVVNRVHDLRKFSQEPDRQRGPNGGRRPQDARAMAPTPEMRNLVYGVRGPVRIVETAYVSRLMVNGWRW
jgi:hypothetical protein